MKFGPTVSTLWNRDRAGRVQDWSFNGQFKVDLIRETKIEVGHERAFELFKEIGFRKQMTTLTLSTEWLNWLAGSATYTQGTDINFDPAPGLAPSLADAREVDLTLTFRPSARLVLEQTYIDNRLEARHGFAVPLDSGSRNAFVNGIPAGGSAADLSSESGNGHLRWLYRPPREPRDRYGATRNPSTHGLGSKHRPSVLRQAQLSLSIVISEFRVQIAFEISEDCRVNLEFNLKSEV